MNVRYLLIALLIFSFRAVFCDVTLKFDNKTGLPDNKIKFYWNIETSKGISYMDTPAPFAKIVTLKGKPTFFRVEAEIGQEQKKYHVPGSIIQKTEVTPIKTYKDLANIQADKTYVLTLVNNELMIN